MRKEMKICLPPYKIAYSLSFIVILCLIRGISYTEEIGAMEEQIALLVVVFCSDTYLLEVQSGRSDIMKLFRLKKRMAAVFRRLFVQWLYLLGISAVNHVNLEVPHGIYGLLGENGAGKTTLMRVLTTVLRPTEGTVVLDGVLYNENNYEKIQQKIGYLPQEIFM